MARARQLHVLFVEDDPIHAMIIRTALAGHPSLRRLTHAETGEAAIDLLSSPIGGDAPDLVLLDIRLPMMDGHAVLRHVRSNPATKPLPVVMVSTSDNPDEVRRAYAAGANAYITKTADFDDFARRLHHVGDFWASTAEVPRRG